MRSFVIPLSLLFSLASSQTAGVGVVPLTGIWTSKSNTVRTGPDFFDPANEKLIEPRLPGISFSFTADGHYEEAIYVTIPNPTTPTCPKAVLQFQHGKYTTPANGSIILIPLAVDGRQLVSDPCKSDEALYTRYNQTELYKKWEIIVDPYVVQLDTAKAKAHYPSEFRLNLYKFDGSPMQPLYRLSDKPKMHPTGTLRPTNTPKATGASGAATGTPAPAAAGKKMKKRDLGSSAQQKVFGNPGKMFNVDGGWKLSMVNDVDLDKWWYIGLVMTIVGGLGFWFF